MRIIGKLCLSAYLTMAAMSAQAAATEVNLYSARKEVLIKPLLDKFSKKTGIQVNFITGKADVLLKRLKAEGKNSPADVFLTTDVGRLHSAKAAGVLQAVKSSDLEKLVSPTRRDPEGYWFGLSMRARTIMYSKDRVKVSELSNYEDLADKKWKGRICIRSSGSVYNQSLMAAIMAAAGTKKAEVWAKKFVGNFARRPIGGDRDQIKGIAAGRCDIAIANTYYLAGMIEGKEQFQREVAKKVGVFWPNQTGRGVHVNVSGAGVTASAKNRANAIQLLEYLVSDEAQKWYAQVNHEYPVRSNIEVSPVLKKWGNFRSDEVQLSTLGVRNAEAIRLMDRVGWL